MKKLTRILSLLLVLCMVLSVMPAITIASATEADADLWIDPVNGSDSNDGTTEQTALKTLQAAKKKAAALSADGDVVVILKGGTYDATQSITFGEAESGQNGHTITYRAASGETALISGGVQLDSWTLHDAAHNIYVADIPKGAELTRQFYVNGEPQPVAAMELTPTDLETFSSYGFQSAEFSSANTTQYLIVDLGEAKLISNVMLYGYTDTSSATGKALGFPENFTIQTSSDGSTWATQAAETGFVAPAAMGGVEFYFSTTDARYIKIEATKLGNPANGKYSLAFAEVQVGFTNTTKAVNLGVVQHVDLDSTMTTAANINLTKGNAYTVNVGSSAVAVGAVVMTADAAAVDTVGDIQIEASADGTVWNTVYSKTDYTWKSSNTFAINPVAATQLRITSGAAVTVSQLKVHAPAELSGTITVNGSGENYLMDNGFADGFNSGVQSSPVYKGEFIVDLGSVQDVGAIRLYPTYVDGVTAGYMKAARVQVSTDGVNYHTLMELPDIQTPTGGAQLLVLPKGYKAQYVKLQPLMLRGDGEYSLQLDELDIVPSTVTGILAEEDAPSYAVKNIYTALPASSLTPRLGYYTNVNGSFVDYEKASGEAECIIDGLRSYGYTGQFTYNELVQWGGSKVPAFLLQLGTATQIGAIEVAIDPDIWSAPLNYEIQVLTGGVWKTVASEDDPQWVDKTQPDAHYAQRYKFDEVVITAARILVYNLTEEDGTYPEADISANPAGFTTDFCLNEFTLYTVDKVTYEVDETIESDTVVHDKVDLTADDIIEFGYYRGADLVTLVEYNDGTGAKMFDGNYENYGATYGQQYQWMPPYGPNIPALVLDATENGKPSLINTIELAVRDDGFCAPYDYKIQVTTSAERDNWTTVAEGAEQDWTIKNVKTFTFSDVEVYKVRLVATLLTPMSNIPKSEWRSSTVTYLHISELTLLNIHDPNNPIATDIVTQGETASGTITYDAKGAAATSSYSSDFNPNRAVDGFIESMYNAGLSVSSDEKYNFSYLKNPEHVEMHSLYLWYHRIQHIVGASMDGTELYVDDGMASLSGTPLMPTWLSNDYMFIDTPGEWYIDRHEGKIYYMAQDTMEDVEAYLPVTEHVIDMEYASNITFEGITFSHTTFTFPSENQYVDEQANCYLLNNTWTQVPGGIELSGCVNVVFDGCQIRNMGTAGIRIKSDGVVISDGCKIINSLVCDISYNGIVIGEIVAQAGFRDWQLVKNATVQNNFVTRIGIDMYDSVGIFAGYTNGVLIDHNEVSYTPYTGISLGWGWSAETNNDDVGNNKITYNYVHDVCKTNYDGGAIYTLAEQSDSEIAYNYIHDSGTLASKTENAIYLDEGTAYLDIHHNVIDTEAQSWLQIWFETIHNNKTHDNYHNSSLSTRGYYVNVSNSTKNNIAFDSLSSNAAALSIANNAGLTDESVKRGEDKGFWLRHNFSQDYWTNSDCARYNTEERGWYDVNISGQIGRTYYDDINRVATIVVPEGTDLSSMSLRYTAEGGWTVTPNNGTAQNFTEPVAYTLTSDGTEKEWLVRVIVGEDTQGIPLPPSDPIPTPVPTNPPATEPVVDPMEKIDLSGCVVGTCSAYDASVSYANQSWWSSAYPDWRDLENFVDGDHLNDISYTVSPGERADFYVDLTRGYGGAVAVDQLKLYYGGVGNYAMTSITIVLELADGTQVTQTFSPNWGVYATPLEWTFEQTYNVKGIYVWADSVTAGSSVTFGEFELYRDTSVEEPVYTVTFRNWDGSVISSTTYHYGDTVTVPGDPTKASDGSYTYTFAGWDKTVVDCVGDAEYTAVFTAEHYHTYDDDCDTSCNTCGADRPVTHSYTTTTTKATLTKDGKIVKACSDCGDVESTTVIARPATFTLSTVNYTYNGVVKTPGVTVKDANGKTLVKGTDYTVTYPSGRINPGSYNVTITMKGNYSGTKTLTFKINLAVPTVKASNAVDGVKITWNAIAGATSYKVYKSVYTSSGWSSWTAIKTGYTGTSYVDTTVKSGHNVRYTVRAFNGSNSSTFKASNSIKFLATPTVKASNAVDGVKLTWNAVGSAKSYIVYKSTYSGGKWSSWTRLKTGVTGTTYTDTTVKSADNVRYTVKAINGNFTSYIKASNSIKFLATPTVKATNAAGGASITWNKITGAKSYIVYKSVYSGGKWGGWTRVATGVTGTSYTDTSVKSGANVRYTVKAINGNFTGYIKASNSIKFLATPTVTVARTTTGIKASWNAVGSAKGYIVYRRAYVNGKWTGWEAVKTTTATSFTDTTAKTGVFYQYTVRAYNGNFKSWYINSASIKR